MQHTNDVGRLTNRWNNLFNSLKTVKTFWRIASDRNEGEGAGKYLQNRCWKFVQGIILYPPVNFFSQSHIYSRYFWDPPIFTKSIFFHRSFLAHWYSYSNNQLNFYFYFTICKLRSHGGRWHIIYAYHVSLYVGKTKKERCINHIKLKTHDFRVKAKWVRIELAKLLDQFALNSQKHFIYQQPCSICKCNYLSEETTVIWPTRAYQVSH